LATVRCEERVRPGGGTVNEWTGNWLAFLGTVPTERFEHVPALEVSGDIFRTAAWQNLLADYRRRVRFFADGCGHAELASDCRRFVLGRRLGQADDAAMAQRPVEDRFAKLLHGVHESDMRAGLGSGSAAR